LLGNDSDLDLTLLDVEHGIRGFALREDDFYPSDTWTPFVVARNTFALNGTCFAFFFMTDPLRGAHGQNMLSLLTALGFRNTSEGRLTVSEDIATQGPLDVAQQGRMRTAMGVQIADWISRRVPSATMFSRRAGKSGTGERSGQHARSLAERSRLTDVAENGADP
jgi:hypothetical protein